MFSKLGSGPSRSTLDATDGSVQEMSLNKSSGEFRGGSGFSLSLFSVVLRHATIPRYTVVADCVGIINLWFVQVRGRHTHNKVLTTPCLINACNETPSKDLGSASEAHRNARDESSFAIRRSSLALRQSLLMLQQSSLVLRCARAHASLRSCSFFDALVFRPSSPRTVKARARTGDVRARTVEARAKTVEA